MSTPLIWIIVPLAAGLFLLILQRWQKTVAIIGTLFAIILTILSRWLPVGESISIGSITFKFVDTFIFLGRSFTLGVGEQPSLFILYLTSTLWLGAAYTAKVNRNCVPLVFLVTGLLTAAIAVKPFLYAALLIEMAVLVSIPLMVYKEKFTGRGMIRYLMIQTIGMPFILFTGWMLAGVEAIPEDQLLVWQASILVGFGFAFLLSVFPLHTWLPMVVQENSPYVVGFILSIMPITVFLLILGFIDHYAWFRTSPQVYMILRFVGVTSAVIAGIQAAFERNLGRILGYAVLFENGLLLVVVGLGEGDQVSLFRNIFFANLIPRSLGLGVWVLALSFIRERQGSLWYRDVQGIARHLPLVAGSLVLSQFSIAGLPVLAEFPLRLAILTGLARVSLTMSFWLLIGCIGIFIGGLRTLGALVRGYTEQGWQVSESKMQMFYLLVGCVTLLVLGLIPQLFYPFLRLFP